MNRRQVIQNVASILASIAVRPTTDAVGARPQSQRSTNDTQSLNSVVAGIRLVDSKLAHSATELARSAYPAFLFNHAIRTYIFGSLVGRAHGHRFDEEMLYLACVLHDLGLTPRFEGDLPFEIQGAEAARRFLSDHGVPREKVEVIWDGIALHASAVGGFKQPEVALVGAGAGADVLGADPAEISRDKVEEVSKAFPRLQFKSSFLGTCADVVRRHPRGATHSFMRDIGERFVPDFQPKNFCDLVNQAPFSE